MSLGHTYWAVLTDYIGGSGTGGHGAGCVWRSILVSRKGRRSNRYGKPTRRIYEVSAFLGILEKGRAEFPA